MTIQLAQPKDLSSIMQVIDDARKNMRANGNHTQWINGYPSAAVILNDINQNIGYICVNDTKMVGYFSFLKGDNPEPTYNVIDNGKWLNNEPYGVIHRLASNGVAKGVAKACFDYCLAQINNIRVDTNNNNLPMQNFLKKYGFVYCGVIYVADGSPRDAFQIIV
ncbi:GNAT family N-acetyltransferase [Paenimyroides aestuarii]|uniref:GNAT family N-acetyltransferase n=1 Tax=Paenimyroides aestuarii TaxID=2968490 RepID=A0ABY5NVE4_9FLAO|nr:GNAT family N-acetyltransferase [Paenimyroides aestuarii]UUV22524.1 GNAT family N-acetyltransferase [Paenimyroides aestuarii]